MSEAIAKYEIETIDKNLLDEILESTIIFKDTDGNETRLIESEIKKIFAPKDATEVEWLTYKNIVKSMGLNPYKREVYFTKYASKDGPKTAVITGYQVYLARVEASDKLGSMPNVKIIKPGNSEAYDIESRKKWKAVFTVKRKGIDDPFILELPVREIDKGQALWNIMPEFMVTKTMLSLGMRLAFADVIGGMPLTAEEITTESLDIDTPELNNHKIQPAVAEQQAKDDAKSEALAKIKKSVDECLTVAMLEERYKKNEKKYAESQFKDEIVAIYAERKRIITEYDNSKIINKLVELTGHKYMDINAYVNPEILSSSLVAAVLNHEADAVTQFTQQIVEFLNEANEVENDQDKDAEEPF